ncbi:uncharacterized protein PG998_001608 [Apiospora kogelbergensis]|uniref:uncharacterized protein n=1 Tax=Apiospora kogelbergensis TaxID=1337665 RepID=UPI003131A980
MDATRPLDHVSIKVEVLRYPRNPRFTGRNWELLFLDLWLSTSEGRACVVGGMPGIGKTQLVTEYAHRFSKSYDCMAWLPSSDKGIMMSAMKHVCQKLGIAGEATDAETYTQAFKSWMSNSKNWLLIFDDVVDWATIEDFLPKTHGSSLVTTRDLRLIPSGTHNLQLDSLDPTSGAEMLSVYLGWQPETISENDQALSKAVSEEVGGFPMALAHVGGYMKRHDLSLRDITERLRSTKSCDLIWREKYILSTSPHPLPLGEIWDSTLADLRSEERAILELLAFFNADRAPQYFWNSRIEDEPQRAVLGRALDELQHRGLVHRKRIDGIMYLSIHRTLQNAMLSGLRYGSRLYYCTLENAIAMVRSACPRREPFDVADHDLWPKYDRVLTQAESLRLRVADDRLPHVVALQLCDVYVEVGSYLHLQAAHSRAQPLLEAGIAMCEAMRETLSASVHATLLLLSVENKNALALPQRTSAIAACNRAITLRKEHPVKDAKMDDLLLADALRARGRASLETSDFPNAGTQLLASFDLMLKHCASHELPYGFTAAYEALSLVRMSQQRQSEALDLIDKAIVTAGLVQKPSAAVFLQLTFNRAVILFNQGDFKEAWKVAKETLRTAEALFGAASSSALSALFWAAHAAYRQGVFHEAERNLRDVLRRSTETQQWPPACVARARYLLAKTLQAMGEEMDEAMQLKGEAVAAIGQQEDSVTMTDFDVRISIYHGRSAIEADESPQSPES